MKQSIKIFLLSLFMFFAWTGFVYADTCYTGASFGQTEVNGEWSPYGTYGGDVSYDKGSLFLFKCDAGAWCVDDAIPTSGGTNQYYSNSGTSPASGTWFAQDGSSPPGTFSSGECSAPPEEESPTSTPISVDQSPAIYFYAISIFVMSFWLGRRLL